MFSCQGEAGVSRNEGSCLAANLLLGNTSGFPRGIKVRGKRGKRWHPLVGGIGDSHGVSAIGRARCGVAYEFGVDKRGRFPRPRIGVVQDRIGPEPSKHDSPVFSVSQHTPSRAGCIAMRENSACNTEYRQSDNEMWGGHPITEHNYLTGSLLLLDWSTLKYNSKAIEH
jgi:hypothetical protein